jgi:hypothetical protein
MKPSKWFGTVVILIFILVITVLYHVGLSSAAEKNPLDTIKRYLPIINKQATPTPTLTPTLTPTPTSTPQPPVSPLLNAIINLDQNNYYTVTWGAVSGADSYNLEEATDPAFLNTAVIYQGKGVSWSVPNPGKIPSTYYYRVKAINVWGMSAWSNVQPVIIYPLFVGLNLRWDGMGYIRGSEYNDVGFHWTNSMDLLSQGYIIRSNNHNWYDPNPYGWSDGYWYMYYSVTSGEFLSSSIPPDPSWKWGDPWFLPYNVQYSNGQTVLIYNQAFIVTGPLSGYTAFGAPVQYWELVNRDQFLIWDGGGDWKEYVYPGEAILRYDAGNTRLEIYSNVLRHFYYQGNPTSDTVQYIINLTASNSFPSSMFLFVPSSQPPPEVAIDSRFDVNISLLPVPQY